MATFSGNPEEGSDIPTNPYGVYQWMFMQAFGGDSVGDFINRFKQELASTSQDLQDRALDSAWEEKYGKAYSEYSQEEILRMLSESGDLSPEDLTRGIESITGAAKQAAFESVDLEQYGWEGLADSLGEETPRIFDPELVGIDFSGGDIQPMEGFEFNKDRTGTLPTRIAYGEEGSTLSKNETSDYDTGILTGKGGIPTSGTSLEDAFNTSVTNMANSPQSPEDAAFPGSNQPTPGDINDPNSGPIDPLTGLPETPDQLAGAPPGSTPVPDGTQQESGVAEESGFNDWFNENSGWIGAAGDLFGGGLAAAGNIIAGNDYSDSIKEEGIRQDKLTRDVLETGIDYANEQTDIGLGLGEPWRAQGLLALAGMGDMLGLDRAGFGEMMGIAPRDPDSGKDVAGFQNKSGKQVFESGKGYYYTRNADGTQTKVQKPGGASVSAPGSSLYNAEFDYNRDRINDANDAFYGAEEYDYKETLRDQGFSYYSGGTDGFQSIFNNLAQIAGFGPQQGPANTDPGINQAGQSFAGNNSISGAGFAGAQGLNDAFTNIGTGLAGAGQGAGWMKGG